MSSISLEDLHDSASRECDGSRDFGSDEYLAGLETLIEATGSSPHAGEALRRKVVVSLTNALASRLASERGWKQRPDCLSIDVPAPVVVMGLPRSGTTALHQIMAVDPQFQWIPAWIAPRPRVRPPRSTWETDPLYRVAVERYVAEGPNALHEVGPSDPQECIRVMQQSFVSMIWVSMLPLPQYHEWFLACDETPSYLRYRDNLRLIGADSPEEPWLLKNPSHTFGLGAMLKVFPDARIVHIYRDPVETIASGASLVATTADSAEGSFTASELGAHRLRVWSLAAERMETARAAAPEEQFYDLDYQAFVADPLEAVKGIYAHFALPLSPEAEAEMRHWTVERPKDHLGRHVYSPGDFGLSPGGIRRRFSRYIQRYGIE